MRSGSPSPLTSAIAKLPAVVLSRATVVFVDAKLVPFHLYHHQVPACWARNPSVPLPSTLSLRAAASVMPVLIGAEYPVEVAKATRQEPFWYHARSLRPSPLKSYAAVTPVRALVLLVRVAPPPSPAAGSW